MRTSRGLFLTAAAFLASLFHILSPHPSAYRSGPYGLEVKIARAVPCRTDLLAGEMLHVVRPGRVRLNSGELPLHSLSSRLEETFRSKAVRIVFVSANPGLSFGDVAVVIGAALTQADKVSLLTPQAERDLVRQGGACLDPNTRIPVSLM